MSSANPTQTLIAHDKPSKRTAEARKDSVQRLPKTVRQKRVSLELSRNPSTTTESSQKPLTGLDIRLKDSKLTLSFDKTNSSQYTQQLGRCAPLHQIPLLQDYDDRRPDPVKTSNPKQQQLNATRKQTSANSTRRVQSNSARPTLRKHGPARVRQRIPKEMQVQWRVGAAPSVAMALSREESQMSKVVAQAVAFYKSMFEVVWKPSIRVNPYIFDLDNRVEVFRDSSVTAACLVTAGKTRLAQALLDRVLPSIEDLLRNPHPQFYLILAELALGLVKTPNDTLRNQIKKYLAARAVAVLGPDHPITSLLSLQVPQWKREYLGDRIWTAVLPILAQTFGPDHYQSSTQVFCHARNMAACGRAEDAIRSIETLIDRWGELYGSNSLIVCYSKIELANVLVAAGSDMKGEFVVSDALRTSDMIQAAELKNEECHASEKRHRESSIAFPRVAGFRTLGRLQKMRGNFGAASYYFSQAVAVGTFALGENSAVVELAQDDLNASRLLELKQAQQRFSLADLSNLTSIVPSPVC